MKVVIDTYLRLALSAAFIVLCLAPKCTAQPAPQPAQPPASPPCKTDPSSKPSQPVLKSLSTPTRTDLSTSLVSETLTGENFTDTMTMVFDPAGMITISSFVCKDPMTADVTFKLTGKAAGTVNVSVKTAGGTSSAIMFDTGVECLEALPSQGCVLRWEVTTTSATGSSNQTNKSTMPNIVTNLDYVYSPDPRLAKQSPDCMKDPDKKADVPAKPQPGQPACKVAATGKARFVMHLDIGVGFTQAITASNVQPTTTNAPSTTSGTTTSSSIAKTTSASPSGSSSSCPTSSSATSAATQSCTLATPQEAFVAKGGASFGLSLFRNGVGVFSELGLAAHGVFEDLVSSNQIVQNGNATYIALGANNPRNAVGIYEATAYYKLSQWGHDAPAKSTGKFGNVSNLVVLEAGYQNNSGLQQLITTSPQTNTRNRFVGRLYLTPEVNASTHTTVTIGFEYSGGIDGGPKIIQLFFGGNLNPMKLFSKAGS